MSAPFLSPFECLLVHKKQPISVYIRLYHSAYSPSTPAKHLLSFLPLPSKLSLRRVSPTTKAWVDSADSSVSSNLSVRFPLNTFTSEAPTASVEEVLALHNISPQCEHLTVIVSQYVSVSGRSDLVTLPPFPRLEHICLIAPDRDPFQSLLSFRLALQRAYVPLLTHLTINNLSFCAILALRWGGFTSFGDAHWTGANVWHGLKELDVKAVCWWDDGLQANEHHYIHEAGRGESEQQKARRRKEEWRSCTRVLHDWLHSFAANGRLHTLRFEWLDGEGPNPFLLDEIASSGWEKGWFSAPAIRWTGLKDVWLGNTIVSFVDVGSMKERMRGLETLVVPLECLHRGLGGVKVVEDGRVWVELLVEGDRMGTWEEVEPSVRGGCLSCAAATRGSYLSSVVAATRGSWRESLVFGDRASMEVPCMLDLSLDDGSTTI